MSSEPRLRSVGSLGVAGLLACGLGLAALVAAALASLTGPAGIPGLPDAGALARMGLAVAGGVAGGGGGLVGGVVLFAALLAAAKRTGGLDGAVAASAREVARAAAGQPLSGAR